jgi:hypothetical protein
LRHADKNADGAFLAVFVEDVKHSRGDYFAKAVKIHLAFPPDYQPSMLTEALAAV